jgi:oligoendopeptidase F
MFRTLPQDCELFLEWEWDQIQPYTDDLTRRELTPETIDEWLSDWSQLAGLLTECFYRLQIRTTTHTDDDEGRSRFMNYSENIMPKARTFEQTMKELLLASGLEPDNFAIPLRKMRTDAEIFRAENLPLQTEIERLNADYDRILGAWTVKWDDDELTPTQTRALLREQDEKTRERAWLSLSARITEDREPIDALWIQLLDLRLQKARNAGFEDFRSYRWKELGRFDYTAEDCKSFHAAFEEVVVPAATRMSEKRKARLGLERLRVWDDFWWGYRPDMEGRPPLSPFTTIDEFSETMEQIFTRVDPVFGGYYHIMREEGLLDLESRKHKSGGAYMEEFPVSKRPFIFSNAVGTHGDVITQLHEGGHAFHYFEASHWPYLYQSMLVHMPMEFVEVGSMAMELLAVPYFSVDQGGFYSEADSARALFELLEGILGFWPYMAVVDAFQHWIYENPEAARDTHRCDDVWVDLHTRFLPHLDWSGIEDTLRIFWRQQGHIIQSPFYYIEYALAQLGAIQVWANALQDQAGAVQAYRQALALGNTASLRTLFQVAGAKFAFDADTLRQAVDLIEQTMDIFDAVD